jgi:hypothetical protein
LANVLERIVVPGTRFIAQRDQTFCLRLPMNYSQLAPIESLPAGIDSTLIPRISTALQGRKWPQKVHTSQ